MERDLHHLFKEILKAHRNEGKGIPDGFFSTAKQILGSKLHLTVAKKNNEVKGFVFTLKDNNRIEKPSYGVFTGFDSQDKKSFTYFNLAFYDPIEKAIREGRSSLQFGTTSYLAKMKRGCDIEERHLRIKPSHWPLKIILSVISPFVSLRYYVKHRSVRQRLDRKKN